MTKLCTASVRALAFVGACFTILFSVTANPNPLATPPALPMVTTVQLQPVTAVVGPVYVTNARDRSNRLFMVEQAGKIQLLQPGQTSATVFLDITSRVLFGGEQGLLGLAFHPQFKTNGQFFLNYTRQPDGATVIAKYHVSLTNPNLADTTEAVILTVAQPFANHNGGMIEFGADGFLYIGMGDGGSGNDPGERAQDIDDLLGKMLRIDIDHPNGAAPYSSPADNPFVGSAGRDEIYAYGFRNPWRFSFDRDTGQIYCGDVGQGVWEEVDIVTRGGNFGWRVFEGNHCTNLDPPLCSASGFIFPIAEYDHTAGRCSITGGYAYRGPIGTLPMGAYVFADFCSGEIFLFENGSQSLLLDTNHNISSFGEDEAGEIYVVTLAGTIYRIVNPDAPCSFFISPSDQSFLAPGGLGSVVVTTPVNCNWTALSNSSFITITAGNSGTGTGAVTYSVLANPAAARTGTVTIAGQTLTVTQAAKGNIFDFDGDAKSDLSIFRPTDGTWRILKSSDGTQRLQQWGQNGDELVPGDYDGDGKTDLAVFRPLNGVWFILRSSNGAMILQQFAASGDVPVPGDYDGDGKTDIAIFHPADGTWRVLKSSDGAQEFRQWGQNGDKPVPADYDGDGKTDIAVFRPSNGVWYILKSSDASIILQQFADPSDVPLPGDYDGDGKADIAIFQSQDGFWRILKSSDHMQRVRQWGQNGDLLTPADYDGDGKADIAVFRPSSGVWFILRSSDGSSMLQQFAAVGDVPVPSAFVQ